MHHQNQHQQTAALYANPNGNLADAPLPALVTAVTTIYQNEGNLADAPLPAPATATYQNTGSLADAPLPAPATATYQNIGSLADAPLPPLQMGEQYTVADVADVSIASIAAAVHVDGRQYSNSGAAQAIASQPNELIYGDTAAAAATTTATATAAASMAQPVISRSAAKAALVKPKHEPLYTAMSSPQKNTSSKNYSGSSDIERADAVTLKLWGPSSFDSDNSAGDKCGGGGSSSDSSGVIHNSSRRSSSSGSSGGGVGSSSSSSRVRRIRTSSGGDGGGGGGGGGDRGGHQEAKLGALSRQAQHNLGSIISNIKDCRLYGILPYSAAAGSTEVIAKHVVERVRTRARPNVAAVDVQIYTDGLAIRDYVGFEQCNRLSVTLKQMRTCMVNTAEDDGTSAAGQQLLVLLCEESFNSRAVVLGGEKIVEIKRSLEEQLTAAPFAERKAIPSAGPSNGHASSGGDSGKGDPVAGTNSISQGEEGSRQSSARRRFSLGSTSRSILQGVKSTLLHRNTKVRTNLTGEEPADSTFSNPPSGNNRIKSSADADAVASGTLSAWYVGICAVAGSDNTELLEAGLVRAQQGLDVTASVCTLVVGGNIFEIQGNKNVKISRADVVYVAASQMHPDYFGLLVRPRASSQQGRQRPGDASVYAFRTFGEPAISISRTISAKLGRI